MMFSDSVGLSDGAGRGPVGGGGELADGAGRGPVGGGGELSEGVATVSDNSAPDKLQSRKNILLFTVLSTS